MNLTRIVPGGQSSYRHAHSTQDEFIYVLEGEVVLETDAGAQVARSRHVRRLPRRNRAMRTASSTASDADVLLLVVGDRSADDVITYPDVDLHGKLGADGKFVFTRKDGTALLNARRGLSHAASLIVASRN